MEDFYDLQSNSFNDALKNYRDSLKAQRDSAFKQLEQTRRNAYASVMGGANRRGMLYSNFPQRSKLQYNIGTYMPAYNKVQTSYQTGLDTLRSNAVNLWNKIQSYQEAINDLNTYGLGNESL